MCPLFLSSISFYSILSLSSLLPLECWFHATPVYSHCLQLLHPWIFTGIPPFCSHTIDTYLNHPNSFFRFSLATLLNGHLGPHPRDTEDNPAKLTLPVWSLARFLPFFEASSSVLSSWLYLVPPIRESLWAQKTFAYGAIPCLSSSTASTCIWCQFVHVVYRCFILCFPVCMENTTEA